MKQGETFLGSVLQDFLDIWQGLCHMSQVVMKSEIYTSKGCTDTS